MGHPLTASATLAERIGEQARVTDQLLYLRVIGKVRRLRPSNNIGYNLGVRLERISIDWILLDRVGMLTRTVAIGEIND